MKRCPHCAVAMTLSPTCWACGLSPDAPVQQHKLDGFEPTRHAPVHVSVTQLADLLHREAAGKFEPLAPLPVACASCGNEMQNATKCPACGAVQATKRVEVDVPAVDAPKACPYCGVPNPIDRSMCVNCASLIGGGDDAV